MTGQQSAKIILGTLSVLTLAVLCITIWKMLGTLVETPVPPGETGSAAAMSSIRNADQPPVDVPLRKFPARVGKNIDISANPDFVGLAATKVSIDLDNADIANALAKFEQSSSLTGAVDFLRNTRSREVAPFTMKLTDAPLLEGVLELCSRTGTTISILNADQLTLQQAPSDGGVGKWCVAGPFAVALERFETSARIDAAGSKDQTMAMSGVLYAEPNAHVATVTRTVNIDELLLEDGGASPVTNVTNSFLSRSLQTVPMYRLQASFTVAPGHGRKISRLRGHLTVAVATKTATIDKDLAATDVTTHDLDGMKVEISPVVAADATRSTVKMHFVRGKAEPKHWQQVSNTLTENTPRFMSDGRALRASVSASTSGPDDRTITYSVTIPAGSSPPQHLILDVPSEMRDVRVPFEFTDLVLP